MAIKKKNYCNEPTLNSHTHSQVTPANAQTQAWQRVFLPLRSKEKDKYDCPTMASMNNQKFIF